MVDNGLSTRLLGLHFDLFGLFLGLANAMRPSDTQINYYRAMFSASVVDMFFVLNMFFTVNNVFNLNIRFETIYIAIVAIGIVALNALLLGVVTNKYHSAIGDCSQVPRVCGVNRWLVLGYAGVQIPWLFLNRSWHLMR